MWDESVLFEESQNNLPSIIVVNIKRPENILLNVCISHITKVISAIEVIVSGLASNANNNAHQKNKLIAYQYSDVLLHGRWIRCWWCYWCYYTQRKSVVHIESIRVHVSIIFLLYVCVFRSSLLTSIRSLAFSMRFLSIICRATVAVALKRLSSDAFISMFPTKG